jgi:hypothetical protein
MKRDRNTLEPGTHVRWLNNGWVLGVIREKIVGSMKTMYLCDPPFGMKHFGGASHTTGWTHSLIGADCLVDLGPDSTDTLTPPDIEYAYNQSKLYFEGKLEKLPEYYPQDRNMFAYWREIRDSSKVVVPEDEAGEKTTKTPPTPTRVRVRPGAAPAPVAEPVPAAPVVRVRTRTRPAS